MSNSVSISLRSSARFLFFSLIGASLVACFGKSEPESLKLPDGSEFSVTPPSNSPTPAPNDSPAPQPNESPTPAPNDPLTLPEPTATPNSGGGICEGGVFCFDFENTEVLPSAFIVTGDVSMSAERAFSGNSSVKVSGKGGYNRNFLSLDLDGGELEQQMYGRMMIWVDNPVGNGGDFTFVQAEGKATPASGAPADTDVFYRYRVAGTARPGTMMANYDTRVNNENNAVALNWPTDCWDHSGQVLPRETWSCVEWHFDSEHNELKFWLNGEALDEIHVLNQGEGCIYNTTQKGEWLAPDKFNTLHLGVEQYHNGIPARTLFIDDVRVDNQYIGCPQGEYLNTPIENVTDPENFVPGPDGNLINSDGTFTSGQSNFTGFFVAANTGSVTWSDAATFTIPAATTEIWHVQMQHLVKLNQGSEYTLCFDAKADAARTIQYDIDLGSDPWSSVIGEVTTINLSTEYQQFSKTFTALPDSDLSRLVFNIGLASVNTSIDNVGIFEGASCREVVVALP